MEFVYGSPNALENTVSASDPVDVFLCHTGANKDWTRDLATKLEAEEVDGRPLKVFFDEWDIAAGENILSKIEEGLCSARFVAVVLSPALTRASWPTLEWQTQVYEDPSGKRARIIPLVVQKHDPETLEPLDIPLPLRLLRYIDFSEPKKFGEGFEQLLTKLRGQRPSRGRATVAESVSAVSLVTGPEVADPVEEVLLSNLFPVTSFPEQLYSHSTNAVRYTDVWKMMTGRLQVPFVLYRNVFTLSSRMFHRPTRFDSSSPAATRIRNVRKIF